MADTLVLACLAALPLILAALVYCFFRLCKGRGGGRISWARLVLGNGLILLLLCAIVLLGGECYYRFVFDSTDAFGMSRTTVAWFQRHWHVNKLGMRDSIEVESLTPPPGHRRVTFEGDSFTLGHGIADVERRFVNLVRHDRPDWEVHVFGELGLETGDEIQGLQALLETGYKLDVFVLVYCLNDVSDMLPEAAEMVRRARKTPPWLCQHSFFLNTLWVRWTVAHDPDLSRYYHFIQRGYEGEFWKLQQERLGDLRKRVEYAHGRLVVVTFPLFGDLGSGYPFREIHGKLDAFWAGSGVAHLDLLPLFAAHAGEELRVSRHDAHPNERAHALAAEAIEKFLQEQMKDKGPIVPPKDEGSTR